MTHSPLSRRMSRKSGFGPGSGNHAGNHPPEVVRSRPHLVPRRDNGKPERQTRVTDLLLALTVVSRRHRGVPRNETMGRVTAVTTATTAGRAATARAPAQKKTTTPRKPSQRPANSKAPNPRRQRASADLAGSAGPRRPVEHAALAAERAVRRNSLHLDLPVVGELNLPAPEQVVFIGGLAVLAVVGLLEWPVAALLGLGHGLATNRHNKTVRAFGEALEEA
jgi:hypothetical protein